MIYFILLSHKWMRAISFVWRQIKIKMVGLFHPYGSWIALQPGLPGLHHLHVQVGFLLEDSIFEPQHDRMFDFEIAIIEGPPLLVHFDSVLVNKLLEGIPHDAVALEVVIELAQLDLQAPYQLTQCKVLYLLHGERLRVPEVRVVQGRGLQRGFVLVQEVEHGHAPGPIWAQAVQDDVELVVHSLVEELLVGVGRGGLLELGQCLQGHDVVILNFLLVKLQFPILIPEDIIEFLLQVISFPTDPDIIVPEDLQQVESIDSQRFTQFPAELSVAVCVALDELQQGLGQLDDVACVCLNLLAVRGGLGLG